MSTFNIRHMRRDYGSKLTWEMAVLIHNMEQCHEEIRKIRDKCKHKELDCHVGRCWGHLQYFCARCGELICDAAFCDELPSSHAPYVDDTKVITETFHPYKEVSDDAEEA